MDALVGKTLGNYRVVERIGRGGMAAVYRAYQPALERFVAIKVIHAQLAADDEQFLKRFRREAKAVATLRHPNIVQVFDFGVEDDVSYMVMEFLDGITLKAELNALAARDAVMPLEETWHILQQIADALEYAHRHGMVHRDIKPANVMLTTKGNVVLTDFGVARIVGATQYTATGAVVGTPAYLSPEQGKGERGDERSDIYALGVVLYEMVTGRVPFDADTPLAVIFKHISDPLPLPRELKADVPETVEQVILKALAKEPGDRYQSVAAMMDALKDAMAGLSTQTEGITAAVTPVAMAPAHLDEGPDAVAALASAPAQVRQEPAANGPRQILRLSPRAWQGIALALLMFAIIWGACGLLIGAVPSQPTEDIPDPESTNFWITRGCFLGPAFSFLFLAYMAFSARNRRVNGVRCSELATALFVALGLVPVLLGLAIMVQPVPTEGDRIFAPLLCLLPGIFIIGVSAIFWALVARTSKSSSRY